MKAVLSTTFDDTYLFYLPITAWSWNKLGIDVICDTPKWNPNECLFPPKLKLVLSTDFVHNIRFIIGDIEAPEHKLATYAQCSRLFAAAWSRLPENEILITGDIDMAVFNKEYFDQANDGQIHVFGADLVPEKQYPICYVAMPVKTWREVMWIQPTDTVQSKLDDLLGHLECDHFRGNYWGKDQETIYQFLTAGAWPVVKHFRAKPGTQFATRRADRDGWPEVMPLDIIDCHMPRPGYTDENFAKILNLFTTMYPGEDFQWMIDYRNEYIKLL